MLDKNVLSLHKVGGKAVALQIKHGNAGDGVQAISAGRVNEEIQE